MSHKPLLPVATGGVAAATGRSVLLAAANRGVLPIAPATRAWLAAATGVQSWHPRRLEAATGVQSWRPCHIEVGTETLPVVNPAGVLSPTAAGTLDRRWRMDEQHKRLMAKAQAFKVKLARVKHSAWLASCRAVIERRGEHLFQKRQARFMKLRAKGRCMYAEEARAAAKEHAHRVQRSIGQEELRSSRLATLANLADARADAHGWGVMTVIDSTVADTFLDTMS